MANIIPTEKWGRKESADWWCAGKATRKQIYAAVTEMLLDLAEVQKGDSDPDPSIRLAPLRFRWQTPGHESQADQSEGDELGVPMVSGFMNSFPCL